MTAQRPSAVATAVIKTIISMIVMPRRLGLALGVMALADHRLFLRRSIQEVRRTGAAHSPLWSRQRSWIAIRLADRPAPGWLSAMSTFSSASGSDPAVLAGAAYSRASSGVTSS